jgi:hypothetical protein
LSCSPSLAYFVWSSSTGKLRVKTTLSNPPAERGRPDARAAFNFFDLESLGEQFPHDPVAYLVPRPGRDSPKTASMKSCDGG